MWGAREVELSFIVMVKLCMKDFQPHKSKARLHYFRAKILCCGVQKMVISVTRKDTGNINAY